jgi:hypothetical protein
LIELEVTRDIHSVEEILNGGDPLGMEQLATSVVTLLILFGLVVPEEDVTLLITRQNGGWFVLTGPSK